MCPDRKNLYGENTSLYIMQASDTQRSTLRVPTDEVNSMGSLTALLGAVFDLHSIRFALSSKEC
jgi:hypothetical protein